MKIRSVKNTHQKSHTPLHSNGFTTRMIIFTISAIILYLGLNIALFRLGRYSAFEQSLRFFQQKFSSSPTPPPPPTPTPTPRTIRPLPSGIQTYRVSYGKNNKGPKIKEAIIDPLTPKIGDTQKVTLTITSDSAITKAEIILHTDTKKTTYPLSLINGTKTDGTWEAVWNMPESYDYSYSIRFAIHNETGRHENGMLFRQ